MGSFAKAREAGSRRCSRQGLPGSPAAAALQGPAHSVEAIARHLAWAPSGRGWDLFGTAGYRVAVGVVGARFAWYLAVIAIVAGHVVTIFLAQVQAMVILPERRPALRSQAPMTALMVAFTIISLSILGEPTDRTDPASRRLHELGINPRYPGRSSRSWHGGVPHAA